MKKNYFFKGMAAVAIVALTASCSKETDVFDKTIQQQESTMAFEKSFAETFGTVNSNQTWKTVSQRNAQVSVNLGVDQNYTVAIYSNNPLFGGAASMLAITQVKEGQTANVTFDAPTAQVTFYVGVFDSKGHGVSQVANLNGDKIVANVGKSSAKARATRATEAQYPTYAKSMSDYLNFTEAEMKQWTALTNEVLTSYPNGNHTLNDLQYMEGQETGKFYGDGDGAHYRIPSGTTVTESFNVGDGATLDNVVLYVEGKAVITPNNNLNAITLVVAPNGEIEFQGENRMSTTGRFVVAAGGKITGTDGALFGIENAAPCYNAGTIDFKGTLRVNGSDFYNCGTVNVDILTGTTKYTTVTNFGKITARTNEIQGEAYNGYYINACYLHFTEKAGIGQLTLLDNSRLDVGGQLYLTGENYMYTLSEINANSIYWQDGIMHGPTSEGEFAVIKSTKFLVSHANDINTYGNIYYDIDPEEFYSYEGVKHDINNYWNAAHHIQGGGTADPNSKWAQDAQYWCKAPITLWSNEATTTLTIPAGECTGNGYNDKEPGIIPIPSDPVVYCIAFEDLGSTDDFDFNDIVLFVEHDVQSNTANVKLMAAGGTLSVDVKYGDEVIFSKNDGKMTNTTTKGNVIATKEVSMTSAGNLDNFSLVVKRDNGQSSVISSAAVTGKAPQALIIPCGWEWPIERINIKDAYPKFADWVKDVNNIDWYLYPDESKIVK